MSVLTTDTIGVTSPAFVQGAVIPQKYTCEGANINPEIVIHHLPPKTASLALIMEDPDTGHGTYDHWLLWNILPSGDEVTIAENSAPGTQGANGEGKSAYKGPCPPRGIHHYHFRIFALDSKMSLSAGSDKRTLINAMEGHIIGTGELIGMYGSTKPSSQADE